MMDSSESEYAGLRPNIIAILSSYLYCSDKLFWYFFKPGGKYQKFRATFDMDLTLFDMTKKFSSILSIDNFADVNMTL